MAADNQITLIGNLVEDPEVRVTPSGATVANFRLAVTPRVRDGEQWRDGETSFFRCQVWRQQAENLAESAGKGARVMVAGRLRTRSWETPEGDKRSVVEVEADEVAASLKFAQAAIHKPKAREHVGAGAGPVRGRAAVLGPQGTQQPPGGTPAA
jgi:single-strand DNA-binding protein